MEEQEYHEEGHNPEYEELLLLYNHVQGHSKSLLVVAEREGFEPSEGITPFAGLANLWFKPLTHLSCCCFILVY